MSDAAQPAVDALEQVCDAVLDAVAAEISERLENTRVNTR